MLHWVDSSWADVIKEQPKEFIGAQQHPTTAEEFFALGVAYGQLKQRKNAEHMFRRALEKNLCHFPSLYGLALRCIEQVKEREARNFYKRAIRLDPNAASSAILLQRELRFGYAQHEAAARFAVWCLQELEFLQKYSVETRFQLGKILFEQSRFQEAVPHLRAVLCESEVAKEATEYLSYIYEHLFHGDELIQKTLELAEEVSDRADLFFNLAMVCQHEQNRLDLAVHFFYLATREDPHDPGLRFSLEQACLELISDSGKDRAPIHPVLLMLAHFYQGSVGVAKRYALSLRDMKFPESFESLEPQFLWKKWLMREDSPLAMTLKAWFEGPETNVTQLHQKP